MHALCLQKLPQLEIVLDDAVVDQRDLAVLADMRMGINVIRLSMGRPAGMTDAGRPVQGRAVLRQLHQVFQPPLRFGNLEAVLTRHTDARRVIAAVFQPRQSFQQDRSRLLLADVSNDTTHIILFLLKSFQDKHADHLPVLFPQPLCFAVTRIFLTASRAKSGTEAHPPITSITLHLVILPGVCFLPQEHGACDGNVP